MSMTAGEIVRQFRGSVGPSARILASYLALVGPITPTIIQFARRTVKPDAPDASLEQLQTILQVVGELDGEPLLDFCGETEEIRGHVRAILLNTARIDFALDLLSDLVKEFPGLEGAAQLGLAVQGTGKIDPHGPPLHRAAAPFFRRSGLASLVCQGVSEACPPSQTPPSSEPPASCG